MRVVCLGEALIDLTPPRGADLKRTHRLGVQVGGAPLNVAVHLRRAGVESHFLGTLSSDSFGDRIREILREKKVEHSPAKPVDAPTRLSLIDRSEGQPPFRFYGNRPADARITMRHVRRVMQGDVQALYVSSLMMTDKRTARIQMEAIRMATERGDVVVVSDSNPRPSAWKDRDAMILATERLLAHSWLTKLSLDDARALGWPDDPVSLVMHLKQRTTGYAVITDGPRGCWLEAGDSLEHIPAPEVPELDSTGAGDAFFARVIANTLRDWAISSDTLRAASIEGALVATKRGAF